MGRLGEGNEAIRSAVFHAPGARGACGRGPCGFAGGAALASRACPPLRNGRCGSGRHAGGATDAGPETRGRLALHGCDCKAMFVDNPVIGRAVLVFTLVEASIFREWVLNVGRRDARSRIAHLLCEFGWRMNAQRLAPSGMYELPMTQEQLADATGLTPV